MTLSQTAQERVTIAFLERLLADRATVGVAPLEAYQRAFPGAEERIAAEYAEVLRESGSRRVWSADRVGAYRLVRLLGRGGQGEVYEAVDQRLGRTVALKLLPRAFSTSAGSLPAQLAREMEALSRLDHPGICVVYDAGEVDGRAYLAMRLVRGEALQEHLARVADGAPRVRATVRLVERVARALEAAHRAGVVHRDVKPSNLMVNESGDPVVLDFGLARAEGAELASFTLTGDLIGTPRYLAPERLRGEGRADPRGDVWALGVTLYELLTGVAPFDGPSFESVARRVASEEPADPRRRQPAIPKDLRAVLAAALEKDPLRRYASMAAFADDLARVLRGEPVLARPLTPALRVSRWMRRNPAPAALLLLLAAGAAAASITARQFGRLATANAETLRLAEARLARAKLEEARLLVGTDRYDRSERILELAQSAAQARRNSTNARGDSPPDAPALAELRGVALDALLTPSARLVNAFPREETVAGFYSANGAWLAERVIGSGIERLTVKEIRVVRSADSVVVAHSSHPDLLDAEEGLAVSDDGMLVALIDPQESNAILWDLASDRRVQTLPLPDGLVIERRGRATRRKWTLAFDPSGTYLAAAVAPAEYDESEPTPRGFALWRLADGERLAGGATGTYRFPWIAFSADGDWCLLLNDEMQVRVLQLSAEGVASEQGLNFPQPVWGGAVIGGAAPRLILALGASLDSTHALWILRLGQSQTERTIEIAGSVEAGNVAGMRVAPDGRRLAFADRAFGLRVVDLERGAEVLRITGAHPANLDAVAWSPDGRQLYSHGRAGDARVWEPSPERGWVRELEIPNPSEPGGFFACAPDASRLAYIHPQEPQTVWTWELDRVRETWRRLEAEPRAGMTVYQLLVASGSGPIVRVARQGVTTWDLEGGGLSERLAQTGDEFSSLWQDANGALQVLVCGTAGYSRMDLRSGDATPIAGVAPAAWAELSPDGNRLLREELPGGSHSLRIFELADAARSVVLQPSGRPDHSVRALRFSACGRWVGGFEVGTRYQFTLWDAADGARRFTQPVASSPTWFGWDSAPDGAWVVLGDGRGRALVVDTESAELLASWRAELSPMKLLRVLPDGRVLTRADAGPAHLWDLADMRRELAALELNWD